MKHYDVIVAGGGTAGALAAVAAARNGAKTLVIERFSFLGGTATYGIPFLGIVSGNGQIVNLGMVTELLERLQNEGHAFGIARGTSWNIPAEQGKYEFSLVPFDPEGLKHVLQQMLVEAGADILYYSLVAGVNHDDGIVKELKVVNKSGEHHFSADIIIDCTGDADVIAAAGGAFVDKKAVQNSSILFRIGSVDLEEFREELDRGVNIKGKNDWHTRVLYASKGTGAPKSLVHMAGHFVLDGIDKPITFTAVSLRDGELFLNATRITDIDGTDMSEMSRAELLEREQVMKVFQSLKRCVRGFENAVLLNTSPLGIRESRNIIADYIITQQDVLEGRPFEDSVAFGAYPIDIHDPKGGATQFAFIKGGGYFSIPYRAMLPKGLLNVIAAGRCIGASHEAQGAVRIMGCVLAQGEAAGRAAAQCIREKALPRDISLKDLQSQLYTIDA